MESTTTSDRRKRSWDYIKLTYPKYISKNEHFAEVIKPYLKSEYTLADLGCGRGLETATNYKECVAKAYGMDLSDAVFQNPKIHEGLIGDVSNIPLPDSSIDIAVSQQVLEHVKDPEAMFREVFRILKHGGIFATMTPNLWYPTTIVSALTPVWFHRFVNRKLMNIDDNDVFPTFYRANRKVHLRELGKKVGFNQLHEEYFMCNPGQFDISPLLTRLEVAFHHSINSTPQLHFFKDTLIFVYQKP